MSEPVKSVRTPTQRHAVVGDAAFNVGVAAQVYAKACATGGIHDIENARRRLMDCALTYGKLVQAHMRNR